MPRVSPIASTSWSTATWRLPAICPANRHRTRSSPRPTSWASSPQRTAVVEDAISGVAAGRAGGFALTVGVDRGAGHDALAEHGADVVVDDLDELLLERRGRDDETGRARAPATVPLPGRSRGSSSRSASPVRSCRSTRPCSPSATATSACAATTRRAATPTIRARSSTGSTRRGASTTPSRRSGSPRPGRRSSTSPTRRSCRCTSTTSRSNCRSPTSPPTAGSSTCAAARSAATSPGAPRPASSCASARSASCRSSIATSRRSPSRSRWSTARHRSSSPRDCSTVRMPSSRPVRMRSPSRSVSPTPSATRAGIARSTTACCSRASTLPTIGRWCSATSARTARCRSPARRVTRSSRRRCSTSTSRSAPTRRRRSWPAPLAAGQSLKVTKFVSYHTSRYAPNLDAEIVDDAFELATRCTRSLDRVEHDGYDALVSAQEAWLDEFWASSDVELRHRRTGPDGGERCRRRRRGRRAAGAAVEPVPARPGLGTGRRAGDRRQGRHRRRLRGALLLGHRDVRRPVPRLHEAGGGPPADALPLADAADGAEPGGRPQLGRCAVSVADDQRRGGVGLLRRRHGPVPHQRGDRLRPQALRRRQRRHRLPRHRRRRDARRDGADVERPRVLLQRGARRQRQRQRQWSRTRERRSTSTASPDRTSTPPWSTTTCTRT